MSATAHFSSDPSVEELQQTVRDLESKVSELREIQREPAHYRAEETSALEIRKRAIDDEIAQLEAHPPRLFKGKHKHQIEDLRIDKNYLDSQIARIESDRASYMGSLTAQIEQTERELEVARHELSEHETEREPLERPERKAPIAPVASMPSPAPREETAYRETMRPALFALMDARVGDDRPRDRPNGRMDREGLDEEAEQKGRILYDYVVGLLCMEWFPGDPEPLITDLRNRARAWSASVDSNDAPFELALANGLMITPLQVMTRLEQSLMAGDVRRRMKKIEETCPGALETSERKYNHVLRIADAEWLRKLAQRGLDRLNQLRR